MNNIKELTKEELSQVEGGFIEIAAAAAALWGAYYGACYIAGQTYYNLTHPPKK